MFIILVPLIDAPKRYFVQAIKVPANYHGAKGKLEIIQHQNNRTSAKLVRITTFYFGVLFLLPRGIWFGFFNFIFLKLIFAHEDKKILKHFVNKHFVAKKYMFG